MRLAALRRRLLPVAAALTAGAVALPMAGCGADDLNPNAVAEAAEATASAQTMRFRSTTTIDGEQTSEQGVVALDPFAMRMDMELPPFGEVTAMMDRHAMYLDAPQMAEAFGAGDARWLKMELSGFDADAVFSGPLMSLDPAQQLRILEAMGDIEAVGEEEVDGVSTTRYEGEIDLRKVADHVDPDQRAAAERSIDALLEGAGAEPVMPTELWIDERSLIRRMHQTMPGEPTVETRMDFFDHGADVDIEIPAGDDVFDITDEIAGAMP